MSLICLSVLETPTIRSITAAIPDAYANIDQPPSHWSSASAYAIPAENAAELKTVSVT